MARLAKGQTMPDFVYDTPFQKGVRLSETAAAAKGTALVFLRYYGCTLCQLDIQEFAEEHGKIVSGGGQMLIVLQSDPEKLAEQLKPGDLPFDIVCDPKQTLYKQFEILPAKSKMGLADFATVKKVFRARSAGLQHGDYEGEELQLPAVFIVTPDRTLRHVHYGKSAGDVPTPEALSALLRQA